MLGSHGGRKERIFARLNSSSLSANTCPFFSAVACFTDDAHLEDWGRQFDGHDGVAAWDETDNIGVNMHFDLQGVEAAGSEWLVSIHATSTRFNGDGVLHVTVDGDRISRLIISG